MRTSILCAPLNSILVCQGFCIGLHFISGWIALIYRRTIEEMSSGNNGEGMGVRFGLAECAFGLGWKSCSGRNDAEWAWVSYESSSSTELRHHACVEHCTGIISPHLPSPRSLVKAWSLGCARSLCHWNLCLWLARNECLAPKYPRGCRSNPFFFLKTSAGSLTSLHCFQKFYLLCAKLISSPVQEYAWRRSSKQCWRREEQQ